MEFPNEVKKITNGFAAKIHSLGFWIIILVLIGIFIGIKRSEDQFEKEMLKSIQIGGMIYNNEVYDIQKRVEQ